MTYKCMIIGLGQIGLGYDLAIDLEGMIFTHSKAFSLHSDFELLCGVDSAQDRCTLFSEYYSKPSFTSIKSALETHTPDVVVIACPTNLHYEAINTVLRYSKPQVILCEKPLAYDLTEARAIVDVCESAGVMLFVNYMRRADPGAIEVKRRIDTGQITQPIKGVAWYSKGLLHNGSHLFNLLEFWLGSFIEARVLNSGRKLSNQDSEPDIQVVFQRGTVIFMAAWEESFSHYTIELLSTVGRLRYEQGGKMITWQVVESSPNNASDKLLQDNSEVILNDMTRYQGNVADQLFKALSGQPQTLSTGKQSLLTLEALHTIINQQAI